MTSHSKRFCTVLTDASWCPDSRAAGWAAWLVCDGNRYKQYGAFKAKCQNAGEAEIKAILNGLSLAKKHFDPVHYHVVSDCQHALRTLPIATNQWGAKLREIVGSARVTFAHVKAHNGTPDKRSYVNAWCDRNARKAMREIRPVKLGGANG